MSDKIASLEHTIEHLKGVLHHADEIVVYEREHNIITKAALDKALAENAKLKNQANAVHLAGGIYQLRRQMAEQAQTIERQAKVIEEQGRMITSRNGTIDDLLTEVGVANRVVMQHAQCIADQRSKINHLEAKQKPGPYPFYGPPRPWTTQPDHLDKMIEERNTALRNAATRIKDLQSNIVDRVAGQGEQIRRIECLRADLETANELVAAKFQRNKWLEDKVCGLQEQARQHAEQKRRFSICDPHPGQFFVVKPKLVTIDALFVGDIPATFEYRNPKSVTLTF